jgi:two-component system, NtrC family, nitrogen regulation sensor histidine kinase NtrY
MRRSVNMALIKTRTWIIIQVLGLGFTPLLFNLILHNPAYIVTRIVLVPVWIIQLMILIRSIQGIERNYIDAIKMLRNESAYHSLEKLASGKIHPAYVKELKQWIEEFRRARLKHERDMHFFRDIIEYLPIGVVVMDDQGNQVMANREIERIFGNRQTIPDFDRSEQRFAKINISGDQKYLSLQTRQITLSENSYRVVAVQNIKEELLRNESEVLKQLIRVLSHEIVNSLNPIIFLSAGMLNTLKTVNDNREPIDEDIIEEMMTGLQAIHQRSKGLNEFIRGYKELVSLPEPNLELIDPIEIIHSISDLFSADMQELDIHFIINKSAGTILINSDPRLLGQVVTNVLKNAIQALEDNPDPKIEIRLATDSKKVYIDLIDNGPGVRHENLNEIFSAFFTTKESGTGLGLALSKKIMEKLNGKIRVHSKPGRTRFRLILPALSEKPMSSSDYTTDPN